MIEPDLQRELNEAINIGLAAQRPLPKATSR
jgi:hypothetical protein